MKASKWVSLGCTRKELILSHTLPNGQCFNWGETQNTTARTWTGVLGRRVIALKQKDQDVSFKCLNLQAAEDNALADSELRSLLLQYFQLDTKLEALYQEWGSGDKRMKQVTTIQLFSRLICPCRLLPVFLECE